MSTKMSVAFKEAVENGEIVEKSGYHQPQNASFGHRGCGCSLTTDKGAYRDVTVRMSDGRLIHFYHQTPVVVEENGKYTLNSGGYHTSTTKKRINRYIPSGYKVIQRDFDWYLETPDGRRDFKDGMEIDA